MSLGINVFRNKRRRKKSRGNIHHLGINVAQSSYSFKLTRRRPSKFSEILFNLVVVVISEQYSTNKCDGFLKKLLHFLHFGSDFSRIFAFLFVYYFDKRTQRNSVMQFSQPFVTENCPITFSMIGDQIKIIYF